MNAWLNYLVEASIGLCLFLLVYQLFLRKETNFRLNRVFLLVALIASVAFPLLRFNTPSSPIPSLNFSVEPVSQEELIYTTDTAALAESSPALTVWEILALLYAAGLLLFLVVFIIRLGSMLKALKQTTAYAYNHHHIVELKSQDSPFSFFNYIFIGNTPPLSEKEKQQIIAHESIHAKLYHSFDIVLLNVLGIVFWFNPLIRVYKKIFVQLHEFEADARAAETHDVDEYCSLLAKVALHSADYKLANHFSNSLTLKRIEMMRTRKHKIKTWKIAAVAVVIPLFFFVVSCQDQVESPSDQATESSGIYPAKVQQALDRLKKEQPETEFIVVTPSGPNPKDFEGEHAKHLSMVNGETVLEARAMTLIKIGEDKNGKSENYIILHYPSKDYRLPTEEEWKKARSTPDKSQTLMDGEPVFYAVDKPAEAPGGIDGFFSRMKQKVQYPEAAKRQGLEGKVFIKFIVKKDGTLTNFEIMKGISRELDLEALRLIKTEQNWTPGMQNGKPVNSQFVLPIEFKFP